MPTNGDGGSSQLFENSPGLTFSANDSAVNPSDFGFVLSEEVVKIDNVQCIVLTEEPERSFGRKPSPNCQNYVLSLKRSRRIGRVWLHSNLDGSRWAVYVKIHEQPLFDRCLHNAT